MSEQFESAKQDFEKVKSHYKPVRILGIFRREISKEDYDALEKCCSLLHPLALYSYKPEEMRLWQDSISLLEEVSSYKKNFKKPITVKYRILLPRI